VFVVELFMLCGYCYCA